MKKTYIAPVLTVVPLGTMTIIAASTLNPSDTNPSVEVSNETYDGMFSTKEESVDDVWDD